MTNHADRSSPKDSGTPARDGSGSGVRPSGTGMPGKESEAPKGQANPQLSEAIDRATAAVGQDDGKR